METSSSKDKRTLWIALGVIVVLCCCCTLIVVAVGVVLYEQIHVSPNVSPILPVEIPNLVSPDPSSSTPEPILSRPAIEGISNDTLLALVNTLVPENDPYDLSCRLKRICDVPRIIDPPPGPWKEGDQKKFWISNANTNEHFQITATLQFISKHACFWAENGAQVDRKALQALLETFDNQIYPTNRAFFGSEPSPGIDGDPCIYIIYANNIGYNVAGYFSSVDAYHPMVHPYSNGHETFVIGADQDLRAEYTYAVLAHEFVHMIQFNTDRNETSWINEGFAEIGAFLNGYDVGGADWLYAMDPDLQLNDWADPNSPEFSAHYGNSFLYLLYFLDRFGPQATQALIANPENDLQSVDSTLADLGITDPQTGHPITADDLFMDWAAALYLQDPSLGDGRYAYSSYRNAPQTSLTETITTCPTDPLRRQVRQYGIDYIRIACPGSYTLRFEGSTVTSLLPADAFSGRFMVWSNKGDQSDMTLTRRFDLRNANAPITLSYRMWYDIEEDWDYLYLLVSEDGQTWDFLHTPSGTDANPTGNSYGWGYTGSSNGWILEEVDLSAYAGKQIYLRFEYITDAAVNGEGLLLDDIRLDAIGYFTDFEQGLDGWEARGFVRVENLLPQTFRLMLIRQGRTTTVESIPLTPDQTAEIALDLQAGETATLIVTGTTRFTRSPATYRFQVR